MNQQVFFLFLVFFGPQENERRFVWATLEFSKKRDIINETRPGKFVGNQNQR